jgi:hypothetical protein
VLKPKEAYEKAAADRAKASEWLRHYIKPGLPKVFTKEDLCSAAMAELKVSRSSFNYAWDWVILETGCEYWYNPLPRRKAKPKPTWSVTVSAPDRSPATCPHAHEAGQAQSRAGQSSRARAHA